MGGMAEREGPVHGPIEDDAEGPGVAASAVIAAFASEAFELDGAEGTAAGAGVPGLGAEDEGAVGVGKGLDFNDCGIEVSACEPTRKFGMQILLDEEMRVAQDFWWLAQPAAGFRESGTDIGRGGDPGACWAEDAGE